MSDLEELKQWATARVDMANGRYYKGVLDIVARLEAAQRENEHLRCALRYYAKGQHFMRGDNDAWDTVSGEPPNFWCDEAGTATVEDGSFAAHSLRNNMEWSAEDVIPIEGEQPYVSLAAFDKETAN